MKRVRYGSLAGLILTAVVARAEPSVPVYTLEQCMDIGLERAISIVNARRDEKAAETRIGQVRAQVLPSVNAKAGYTRYDEAATMDYGDGEVQLGELDNYSASVEASQLLYSGGSVNAALKAARLYRDSKKLATSQALNELKRDIRTGFYDILLAEANVGVQEESVTQLESFVQQVEAKYKAETASEFDLISARVKLANQVPVLIAARKGRDLAKASFRNLIHLDEADYAVTGALAYASFTWSLEDLQQRGLLNRPEIKHQEKTIGLLQADVRAEKGGYLPQLRARAQYAGNDPPQGYSGETGWDWHWNAGINAEWSVWDGDLRRQRVKEKTLELLKAEDNLAEVRRAVLLDIQSQYLSLRQAAETVNATGENVALAEKSLNIARTRYDAGLATYLEFTDANLALRVAQLTWYQALREHTAAVARLVCACGFETEQQLQEGMPHE